jgi:CheY-like chemotaxis protein
MLRFPSFARRAARPAPGAGAVTVLVADADQASRDVQSLLIRYYGYGVVVASTHAEAMRIARSGEVGGVVCEPLYDVATRRTLVEALATEPRTCRLPVVVVSAPSGPAAREWALASGAVAVLEKPCNGVQLREALLEHMGPSEPTSPPRPPARS